MPERIGPDLPPDVMPYKRTPTFDETTVPAGLLKDHATKAGIWGVIHVLAGELRYVVPTTGIDVVLDDDTQAVITPEQLHHVTPIGRVQFYVAFWR